MKATPHINPTHDIAETILLPGDPLRAKFIAENFLDRAVQFNAVRGALGFTGRYKGKPVSVMGTGMGMPSIGIYAFELIQFFGVQNLIRVGSCGALQPHLKLYDIILAQGSSTNSRFGRQYSLPGDFAPLASYPLLEKAIAEVRALGLEAHVGNVLSSDTFYDDRPDALAQWEKMGILGVEMESAALYMTAARYQANALCMLTVSDHILTREETTAEERERSFTNMMTASLETAIRC